MSANNELVITKSKDGYQVSNVDVDCGGGYFLRDEPFATLKEAIKFANENLENVEYGLRIII